MNNTPNLCIALDLPTRDENLTLCKDLAKNNLNDIYLKVGLRSFIRDGSAFLEELQKLGFKIFLDLKLYDIPNTMLDALSEILKLKVDIITIHSSSGRRALSEIANFLKKVTNPPLIFAVTALTSFSDEEWREIYNQKINLSALNFAKITSECGINGVVCSVFESKVIKENFNNILTLTPGIRPCESDFIDSNLDSTNKGILKDSLQDSSQIDLYDAKDDQKRISSLDFAMKQKADFIVVGRPIYKSTNPISITKKILNKLEPKEAK
ncbi:MAG: orotidine-5'-phosphate decarboxylase [Helicobacteraceae bacterium]|nr:orotidine-5'-phosphate decarboxylase [Helicobacteraceae bacterium]